MKMTSKKNVKKPDETRNFDKGNLRVMKIGEFTLGLSTFLPGWKWSKSVKPIAKTESCKVHHVGYIISGRMSGVMDDGAKWELGPGDAVEIHPGHDAWTVGRKPVVFLDFMGAAGYAKK
jgi:hypothetical protein